jgi:protoporphyrinogen oxidase
LLQFCNIRKVHILPKKTIAIIGGGISGIVASMALARTGRFDVTLFEKEDKLGGLSTWFESHNVIWDKYYHVVLSTDTETIDFISELGLQEKIFWRETKSGFLGQGRLVSMSSALDFLRFPFMSLWQKFRMGIGILYTSKIRNPSRLDKIFAKQWLSTIFGRRVYENIWEPLLRSKLGEAREKTSALFIWATIHRLYGTRQGKEKKEKMGHVHGGYHAIIKAAAKKLTENNVIVHDSETVLALNVDAKPYSLVTSKSRYQFDQVLFTVDCPTILGILNKPQGDYWHNLDHIDYLGIFCVVLFITKQLSPYYVINLLDKELPFTGIIEATNVVSPTETGNKHIVFLPKYAPSDDPMYSRTDKEIIDLFIDHLKKAFPGLHDEEIVYKGIHKTRYVQPIQTLRYQENIPAFNSPIPDVFIVNTSMIVNSTLNNNTSISLARECVRTILNKE